MYVDTQSELSDAQAVTATAISSNVLDLLTPTVGAATLTGLNPNTITDIGQGEDIYLVVATAVAATDTGSDATLTVSLESDTVVGLSSAPVVHFSTGALAFAAFAPAGTILAQIKLPNADYKRYLGVRYTVASGPLTAGAFDAFLTKDIQRAKAYKSAFTVQ